VIPEHTVYYRVSQTDANPTREKRRLCIEEYQNEFQGGDLAVSGNYELTEKTTVEDLASMARPWSPSFGGAATWVSISHTANIETIWKSV
jgi:hypothetical protein